MCNTRCKMCGDKYYRTTAYGVNLCEDDWDEYIQTSFGKIEYFISVCAGEIPVSLLDAELLGEATVSWLKNREITSLSRKQKNCYELIAKQLGLLDLSAIMFVD